MVLRSYRKPGTRRRSISFAKRADSPRWWEAAHVRRAGSAGWTASIHQQPTPARLNRKSASAIDWPQARTSSFTLGGSTTRPECVRSRTCASSGSQDNHFGRMAPSHDEHRKRIAGNAARRIHRLTQGSSPRWRAVSFGVRDSSCTLLCTARDGHFGHLTIRRHGSAETGRHRSCKAAQRMIVYRDEHQVAAKPQRKNKTRGCAG